MASTASSAMDNDHVKDTQPPVADTATSPPVADTATSPSTTDIGTQSSVPPTDAKPSATPTDTKSSASSTDTKPSTTFSGTKPSANSKGIKPTAKSKGTKSSGKSTGTKPSATSTGTKSPVDDTGSKSQKHVDKGFVCLWRLDDGEVIDPDNKWACTFLFMKMSITRIYKKHPQTDKEQLRKLIRERVLELWRLHGPEAYMYYIKRFFTVAELAELIDMGPIDHILTQSHLDGLAICCQKMTAELKKGDARISDTRLYTGEPIFPPPWWNQWSWEKDEMITVTPEDVKSGARLLYAWVPDDGEELRVNVNDDVSEFELGAHRWANRRGKPYGL